MTPTASPALSLIPFAALLLLVVFMAIWARMAWKRGHRIYAGEMLWTLPPVILLLLVAVFCVRGGVGSEVGMLDMGAYSIVLVACGVVSNTCRRPFFAALDALPHVMGEILRALIAIVSMCAVSIACAWIVDFSWLAESGLIAVQYVFTTALIFFLIGVALYFLGQRTGVLVALVPLAAVGFGIAQYFVVSFKGAPIMPSDLLALETAAAVSGGYEYILTPNMVIALCATGICFCVLSFVGPRVASSPRARVGNAVGNTVAGVVLLFALSGLYGSAKLEDVLEYEYDPWMPIETYRTIGFVPAFIEVAQDLAIPVPEQYDEQATENLMADLAAQFDESLALAPDRVAAEVQFNEVQPSVVVVMNETFSDMSIYDEIRAAGYEGPQNYKSLPDVLQRGTLRVPVVGGGTANSEFEFLTGNSIAFIGSGKYPYQLYDLSESDSLAKQFDALGYVSTAMHPQSPVNWKRSTAYKQLGFDDFLSIESFESAPWYHSGATDTSTYDKVLELLNQDASPQFIFDVTMQNHSGYAEGSVPFEDMVNLAVPGVEDEGFLKELGVYLACIERSDEDFAYFIEQLRAIERPVVLVFFGDHQPGLSTTLDEMLYAGGEVQAREVKKYGTTYTVWANYEIAGAALNIEQETSASQLAANVLYRIGAPLTDRQKADLVLGQSVTSLSPVGYRGADGVTYALEDESAYKESLNQMQAIQYLTFAEKVQ